VAIAFDRAFHTYDPDMLDLLETLGAMLRDFSPLKTERLPPDVDLVLLGDGTPQRFAQRLASNVCLKQSLREHVLGGGRVYAEGGGLAYICQLLQVNDHTYPMAGLLPAIALHEPASPRPVELRLTHGSWLFGRQAVLRGYRNTEWQLTMSGPLVDLANDPQHQLDLVGFRQVIGSRVHFHFSAQPALLRNLIQPSAVKAR
jgi:cobyrinic acid a,c-diamide synthase